MADDTPREHRITTDRNTIREWADEHDVVPVRRREGDESTFRFVQRSEADDGDRLEWDEFHTEMGESNHVVVHEEEGTGHPLGVYDRSTAISRSSIESDEIEDALVEGKVVTGEITETTVVETTVIEEAEIESELVDTDIVGDRVVDVELESRECTNCSLVETSGASPTDWFDTDHYLESHGDVGMMATPEVDADMVPYQAELDVEERYRVTREIDERFTIETRIADTDVTEMDTIESQDVDVEGLQRSLVESNLLEFEERPTRVVADYDIETEFVEGDRIQTYIDRQAIVEDVVRDRKQLHTEITDIADHEMELVESERRETTTTSEFEGEEAMAGAGSEEATGATDEEEFRTVPTEDDEGKDVVDATGNEVGMIVEVDETEGVAYVDPHPGVTDRIKAVLDMGNADEGDYPLRKDQIKRIEDDYVEIVAGPDADEDEMT